MKNGCHQDIDKDKRMANRFIKKSKILIFIYIVTLTLLGILYSFDNNENDLRAIRDFMKLENEYIYHSDALSDIYDDLTCSVSVYLYRYRSIKTSIEMKAEKSLNQFEDYDKLINNLIPSSIAYSNKYIRHYINQQACYDIMAVTDEDCADYYKIMTYALNRKSLYEWYVINNHYLLLYEYIIQISAILIVIFVISLVVGILSLSSYWVRINERSK